VLHDHAFDDSSSNAILGSDIRVSLGFAVIRKRKAGILVIGPLGVRFCDPDSIGCQWLRDTLIALTALAFQHGFFTFHLLTLTLYERAITLGAGTSWL
jgi:hypothetical protein